MPLQFRRGTDSQRSTVTPAAGEPLWITDTSKLYIGDGTSTGGIEVSGGGGGGAPTNASYIVLGTNASLSAERALSIGTGLASTDGGAGGTLSIALGTHTHSAGDIASGTVALARGGLAADISTTGGTGQFLRQTSAGGPVSVGVIAATDLPTHNHVASNITSGTLALSVGGLAADLSATGGAGRFLKQTSAGAAVSVAVVAATDLATVGTPGTDTFLRGDLSWGTPAGGGGGAPVDVSYVVLGTNATLTAERVLVIGSGLTSTDGGAGGNLTVALGTHTHSAGDIQAGTLALARGGVGADISGTGGTAQFLKQTASGGAVSVGTIAATEVGTSGTPSTSTYLRGDMTWGTPAGGSGGTKSYARFTPLDNQPTTSAYATFDTRNGIAVLDYDPTAAESAVFVAWLPEAADTSSGLKVRLLWTPSTSTSTNAVVWGASLQRLDTSTDINTDSFGGTVTASANASGTAGVPTLTEITLTGTTNLDSVSAGDAYRLKITRDATAGGDDLADDAELISIELRAV